MAIKFEELHNKLFHNPLSKDELSIVDSVENYLDKKLTLEYVGGDVLINLEIVDFKLDPVSMSYRQVAKPRMKLMREELLKRYDLAGWECFEKIADENDRYGRDWMVFRCKNL